MSNHSRPHTLLDATISDHGERVKKEFDKAVEKYGAEAATLPTGDPTKDVHDYAINELVGLERYADMIAARHQLLDGHNGLAGEGRVLARDISTQAHDLAMRLIALRLKMRHAGLLMGAREK